MGLGCNGCFVTGAGLMDGHYRMDIISGVAHLKSDSIMPVMLCTVAYNIRGTSVVLYVPQDNANPTKNGYYIE